MYIAIHTQSLPVTSIDAIRFYRQPFFVGHVSFFWVCASLVMFVGTFPSDVLLFPDDFQYHACFGFLVNSIIRTFPKYIHLVFNIVASAVISIERWPKDLLCLMCSQQKHDRNNVMPFSYVTMESHPYDM